MEQTLVIALVGILGIGAQWLAWRLQAPAIVLMALAGLAVGPLWAIIFGDPLLDPVDPSEGAPDVVSDLAPLFTAADVIVVGLIGERGREAREFIEDDLGDVTVTLELLHTDAMLCVPLLVAGDLDDVAADWRAWSEALGLPMLMIEAGTLEILHVAATGVLGVGLLAIAFEGYLYARLATPWRLVALVGALAAIRNGEGCTGQHQEHDSIFHRRLPALSPRGLYQRGRDGRK